MRYCLLLSQGQWKFFLQGAVESPGSLHGWMFFLRIEQPRDHRAILSAGGDTQTGHIRQHDSGAVIGSLPMEYFSSTIQITSK
jgi:hypothetical protein